MCIFRHDGEPITWECESRRSRRRKKKKSNGCNFIARHRVLRDIYIYIYNIIGRLGNRNERSEWKHVRGRVGSTIINSLLSSLFRMFVNFGISIDEKERFILTLFRNDTMYCRSFSRFSHFKNQNGRAVELFSRV